MKTPHDYQNERVSLLLNADLIDKKPYSTPKGSYFLIVCNLLQSISYWSLITLLTIYFDRTFHSNLVIPLSIFFSVVYFSVLFMAMLSDSFWGAYKTVVISCCILLLSYGLLIVWDQFVLKQTIEAHVLFIVALVIQAIGSGGILPCLSSFLGDHFDQYSEKIQMSSFFGWFYLTVQFGVVIARFVTPLLLNYSNLIALITYAVIVLLSLIIFVIGKLFYEIKPSPKENILFQFFSILFRSIPNCCERGNPHWIRDKTGKYDQSIVEDTKEVVNLLKLFLPLPIFWALYFQIFTTLYLQAKEMEIPFNIDPAQIATLNPVFDLLLIPLLNNLLYPLIRKCGFNFTPLRKISFGLICSIIAFVISGFVQMQIEASKDKISVLYQIPVFFFLSLGEVTVYIPFLHYGYCEAPERWKGFMQALCWFSIGFGTLIITIVGVIFSHLFDDLNGFVHLFFFFAGLMTVFTVLFIVIAVYYKSNQMNTDTS